MTAPRVLLRSGHLLNKYNIVRRAASCAASSQQRRDVPRFFDCHLRGDADACGHLYGGSGHNGVCKDLPMYECHKA